jgi:surface carbohydrate biosynthesis protein (TIGR04326 family)
VNGHRALSANAEKANQVLSDNQILPAEKFLSPLDTLSFFDPFVFLKAFVGLMKLKTDPQMKFMEFSVSEFLWEDILFSWVNGDFFSTRLAEKAFAKALKYLRPKAILYRLEFQPIEYALINASKTIGAKTIGFQHSAASRNFLSYVFEKGELKNRRVPLSDLIFTTGEIGQEILVEGGYPKERMRIVGPIRYRQLIETRKNHSDQKTLRENNKLPLNKKILYVAASPLFGETISMLESLYKVTQQTQFDGMIVFKTHPSETENEYFKKYFKDRFSSSSYIYLEGIIPFYDYVLASDCLMLTGSTVGAEALGLGTPVIVFKSPAQFGNDSLADHPQSVLGASDSVSLSRALDVVFKDSSEINQIKGHWPKTLKSIFFDLDSDPHERFEKELEEFI